MLRSVLPGNKQAGANLVLNKSVFPLTPRFSAVQSNPQPTNRFNGFLLPQSQPTGKPLKRLDSQVWAGHRTEVRC